MAYAPGIQYHGDQYLNAGINKAFGSIADAVAKRKEREKTESQEYDALSTLFEAYGMGTREQAKIQYNLPQLRGALQGAVVKQAQAKAKVNEDYMREQIATMKRNAGRDSSADQFMRQFASASMQQGPTQGGQPISDPMQAFMMAAQATPEGADSRILGDILRSQGRNTNRTVGMPQEGELDGVPYLTDAYGQIRFAPKPTPTKTPTVRDKGMTDAQRFQMDQRLRTEEDKVYELTKPLLRKDSKSLTRSEAQELKRSRLKLDEIRKQRDQLWAQPQEDAAAADADTPANPITKDVAMEFLRQANGDRAAAQAAAKAAGYTW